MRDLCEGRGLDGRPHPAEFAVKAFREREGLEELIQSSISAETQLPPRIIRGINFAAAIAKWTAAGMPMRTDEEIKARLLICQECPEFVQGHCSKCGCPCVEANQIMNKLALKTEKCPIGKWE